MALFIINMTRIQLALDSGEHFYTSSEGERNHLISLGWNDEGIGWYGTGTGG